MVPGGRNRSKVQPGSSLKAFRKTPVAPILWFYEVGNGLLMAHRRKRISSDQIDGFLRRLQSLPIEAAKQTPADILALPSLARRHGLTNYDAAYLGLAIQSGLPLATGDAGLRQSAAAAGVQIV
jgi:predicted nucleic acid-binding protein